jgi:hypothetical protein
MEQPVNNNENPILPVLNAVPEFQEEVPASHIKTPEEVKQYFVRIVTLLSGVVDTPEKMTNIYNKIKKYAKYRDNNYDYDNIRNSIFSYTTPFGNNLLLVSCIKNLKPICLEIVKKYGNLFDLGHYNSYGETVLIFAIKNKMLYYAAFLIGYCIENPYKDYEDLNIEQKDDNGKTALDYLFELDKTSQASITKFQVKNDGPVKQLLLLEMLFGYFLENYPNSPETHRYIRKICNPPQDFGENFYFDLLKPYFEYHPNIKFTKKFCKEPVIAEATTDIPQAFPIPPEIGRLRSNIETDIRAPILNPVIALPDNSQNFDENDSDDERIERANRSYEKPAPLQEYNPVNPGAIISYPRPPTPEINISPPATPVNELSELNEYYQNINQEDEGEHKTKKQRKDTFEPEFGGKKRSTKKKRNKYSRKNKSYKKLYKKSYKK